jgi:protein-arginine kinase activator protein McsA
MDKHPLIVEYARVTGVTVPTCRALEANGKKILSLVSKIAHSCTPEQVCRVLAAVTSDVLSSEEIDTDIAGQPANVLGCALALHYRRKAEETLDDWNARVKTDLDEVIEYNLHAARVSVLHGAQVVDILPQQEQKQQHPQQYPKQQHQPNSQQQLLQRQNEMDDIFDVHRKPNETAALRDELRELRRQYSEDKAIWHARENSGGRTAECEQLLREVVQMHPQLANASREPIMEEMMDRRTPS